MNNIGKWVILYSYGASPIGLAQIIDDVGKAYELRFENGNTDFRYKYFCVVKDTKELAEKEYYNYISNKRNYAPEG